MAGFRERDGRGWPVLLANVAPSGVTKADPNAASGNPNHDTRSGKFGSGGGGGSKDAAPAPNSDAEAQSALRRRQDAVRDASRSLDTVTADTAREFLEGRVADADQVDVDSFVQAVAAQRVDDVADALYANLLKGGIVGGTRGAKLVANKGWIGSSLNGLQAAQVQDVFRRLVARGVDAGAIAKKVVPSLSDVDLRKQMKSEFGGAD